MYSNHRSTLDAAVSRSFGNNFTRNVVIFSVDNNVLELGEGPADDTNGSVGSAEQKILELIIIIISLVLILLINKFELQ